MRRAALLAPGPLFQDSLCEGLEAAGYAVTLVTPADLDRSIQEDGVDAGLARPLAGEPEVLVTGDAIFPHLPDPDLGLSLGLERIFAACKIAMRSMLRRRFGRIVSVAPGLDTTTIPHAAVVGGIGGLVKSVAREVGSRGITANLIAPGYTEAWEGEISHFVAIGRPAAPGDIASAVSFLVGDGAGYITGQVLAVDGGLGAG